MVKLGKTIPAGDLFQLDDASSIPVWLQLKNRFIYLITSGFYLPGDQLPTVRGLAAEVEVNYNTVSKVYQSLEEDGYIVSKRRLGAFVADVSDKPGVSAEVTAEIVTAEYLSAARSSACRWRISTRSSQRRSWPPRPSARRMAQAKEQPMTRKKHGADARQVPEPAGEGAADGRAAGNGRNRTSATAPWLHHHRVRRCLRAGARLRQALAGVLAAALVIAGSGALASSVHIVMEWERAVVMRFGRFNRVAGPGIVFTWPVIEFYTVRIDQRVAATYFGAEETLTSDLVPVNVDAVVFWMVFSPKKAATEVEDYASAVAWMAQATLRAAIGRASLAEVACRRDQLDAELKEVLEAKLDGWGIDVIDVEVRDIVVPRELQPAMAAAAVAARERDARMTLAEAEADISDMLKDASANYEGDPEAMRLRTMHLAYEAVKQSGGTLVIPSAFSEGFTDPDTAEALAKAAKQS
ncbi:MAG: SPFH domain-containing protein [Coriobacteriaceae bacterium]